MSTDTKNSESPVGDLSEALKESTKDVHEQAENTEFMKNFQKGQVSLEEFKLVMSSLYFIYSALEEEIERNKENPCFAPVYFPTELHRKSSLEKDMLYFYGSKWRSVIHCPEAVKKYVERLHYVGQKEPQLLVAHAYTRYLGDLSGGQVLKKIAQKALQLPSTGEGLAFFTFDAVSSAMKFKQLYRSRMNSLDLDKASKEKVVEEARTAFLLNIKMFEQLQEITSQSQTAKKEETDVRKRVKHIANGQSHGAESNKNMSTVSSSPFLRYVLGFGFLLAVIALGLQAL